MIEYYLVLTSHKIWALNNDVVQLCGCKFLITTKLFYGKHKIIDQSFPITKDGKLRVSIREFGTQNNVSKFIVIITVLWSVDIGYSKSFIGKTRDNYYAEYDLWVILMFAFFCINWPIKMSALCLVYYFVCSQSIFWTVYCFFV